MRAQNNQVNIILLSLSTTIAIILGVCLLEGYFILKESHQHQTHWVDPNTEFDSHLGWRIVPSQTIQVPGWGKVSSNSKGYRSGEIEEGKKNILILGDSVAWGYGMNDEKIFSYYLQEDLDAQGFQIHNLAVSGYGVGQYYLHLKKNLSFFEQVDTVYLVIYGPNDLYDTRSNEAYGKRKPYFVLDQGELKLRNKRVFKYSLRNLLSMSRAVRYLETEWPALKKIFSKIAGDRRMSFKETEPVVVRLINEMEALVREKGGRLRVVISPSIYDFFKVTSGFQWFEEYCKAREGGCLNLRDEIKARSTLASADLFGDEHHYNSKGHRLVADVLLEDVA